MKRILPLILTVCVLIACLAVPAFAYSVPSGANKDVQSGRLFGKIIHWQNYVTSSVQGTIDNQQGWVTTVRLPSDSVWGFTDYGSTEEAWYTTTPNSGTFQLDSRYTGIEWETPYYISIEDLKPGDPTTIKLGFATNKGTNNVGIKEVYVHVSYYDMYMNILGLDEFVPDRVQGEDYWQFTQDFILSQDRISAGTKYLKILARVSFEPWTVGYLDVALRQWDLLLPYQYDELRFAVDGIDAWMNGYFRPITPDSSAEDDIWAFFAETIADFNEFIERVKTTFRNYNQGFKAISFLFQKFYYIKWVHELIDASIAVGAIAFFFGISITLASRVGSSARSAANRTKANIANAKNRKANKSKKGE